MPQETKQKYRSWSDEEDNMLKDLVLEKVRNGQTQQDAFEIVANETDRSVGSVAFRWNNKVRKNSTQDLQKAKQEAKKRKITPNNQSTDKPSTSNKSKSKKDNSVRVLVSVPSQEKDSNTSTIRVSYEDVISFINEKRELEEKFENLSEAYESLQTEHTNLNEKFNEVVEVVTKIKGD